MTYSDSESSRSHGTQRTNTNNYISPPGHCAKVEPEIRAALIELCAIRTEVSVLLPVYGGRHDLYSVNGSPRSSANAGQIDLIPK